MTQEIKDKLEQTARDYIKQFAHQLHLGAEEGLIIDLVGFAQTILNNPGEWGLMPILDGMQHIQDPDSDCNDALSDLKAENTRLREALEAIKFMCDANDPSHEKFWRLAFNATKKGRKMKHFPVLDGRAMVVELPEGATYAGFKNNHIYYYQPPCFESMGDYPYSLALTNRDWELMGWLTEVTESDVIPLVGNKYNWFGTALESLESAILEEGYAFVNPYGETEPEALFINTEEDKHQLYEAKLRWMTAQSRALCRERCLLLMKIEVI